MKTRWGRKGRATRKKGIELLGAFHRLTRCQANAGRAWNLRTPGTALRRCWAAQMSATAVAEISLSSKTSLSSKAMGAPWKWVSANAAAAVQRLDTDAALVGRCLRGEQGGWEELVRTHTRRV